METDSVSIVVYTQPKEKSGRVCRVPEGSLFDTIPSCPPASLHHPKMMKSNVAIAVHTFITGC